MLRSSINGDMEFERERMIFDIVYDFGEDSHDRWTITASAGTGFGDMESVILNWDFSERSNRYEHVITITSGSPWRANDTVRLVSDWNPESGFFTLSAGDGFFNESFSGLFTLEDDGGFRLRFDDMTMGFGDSLGIEVRTSPDVDIASIDFININDWTMDMIQNLQRNIFDMSRMFW